MRTIIMSLVLIGVSFWLYLQPGSEAANNWSWEDQIRMEDAMAEAARQAPGTVPEIDRSVPETETALFALG
jgi:hypothetical protein